MITALWAIGCLVTFFFAIAATAGHRISLHIQNNRYRQAELKSFEKSREIQKLSHQRTKALQEAQAAQAKRSYNKVRDLYAWDHEFQALQQDTYFKGVK